MVVAVLFFAVEPVDFLAVLVLFFAVEVFAVVAVFLAVVAVFLVPVVFEAVDLDVDVAFFFAVVEALDVLVIDSWHEVTFHLSCHMGSTKTQVKSSRIQLGQHPIFARYSRQVKLTRPHSGDPPLYKRFDSASKAIGRVDSERRPCEMMSVRVVPGDPFEPRDHA